MKIKTHQQHGSALMATLVIAAAVGIMMASYMKLVSNQNESIMRSLSWNTSIPVLEAGLEDALTHIHQNTMDGLGKDGWQQVGGLKMAGLTLPGTQYLKQRKLDENSYYRVAISATAPPIVVSEGYVKLPLKTNFVMRAVRITTRSDGMFTKGMVAKGKIDLNGQDVVSDSFDSSDPLWSTLGQYDKNKVKDNGDVATNSGITGNFNVGQANIFGHASTGPGGNIDLGPGGGIGTHLWQATHGGSGIQPGYTNNDMNVQFPDVKVPFTSGYSTPSGTPLMITSSGDWQITGDLAKTLIVASNVQARLLVTGDVNISGQDKIEIQAGGSLKFYVQGATASIAGNGVVNTPGSATNFYYFGLPTNTKLTFNGNAAFIGAIYAPNAEFALGGGGNNVLDFMGASVTASAKMNGHFNFHYDELLGKVGPVREYVVTSWNETWKEL